MNSIIVPALIVAVIGLVAGVILTGASKLMYVPVDEKIEAIREVLPGANCGACGFAGCDDYAAALGEDANLSTALCPVGGALVAKQVSTILGVEGETVEPKAAAVMCQGTSGIALKLMQDDRIYSCRDAKMFYGGPKACPYGCIGLGDCAAHCRYDAIRIVDGVAVVDPELCVGCGVCATACPNHIISIIDKKSRVFVACKSMDKGAQTRKICSNGCIGCMKCQKACPFDAIFVENNVAKVDFDKCRNCGKCVKECPTGAVVKH